MLEITQATIDKVNRDYKPDPDKHYMRITVGPGWGIVSVFLALEESINEDDHLEVVEGIPFIMRKAISPIFSWYILDYKDGFMGVGDFLLKVKQ